MLSKVARGAMIISILASAGGFWLGTTDLWLAGVPVLLVGLFFAWTAGVADGHAVLKRKNPEAFSQFT